MDETLKDKEIRIPEGLSFTDKDGTKRCEIRIKWWEDPSLSTYREISVIPLNNLPENPVDLSLLKGCTYYSHVEKPVFFGHYWLNGDPQLIKSNICYPDYSVAKYGCLAAYSFDRKKEQSGEKFTFV